MLLNISSLAYQVQQSLSSNGITMSRTRVNEVLAAILGYGTYAAYHADDKNPAVQDFITAEHIILQPEYAISRCEALGMDQGTIYLVINLALTHTQKHIFAVGMPPFVYQSQEDFEDSFLRNFMEQEAVESGEVSSEMAATNAYLDMAEVENIVPSEEFLKANGDWQVVGNGAIHMEQDEDRPFSGNRIDVTVTTLFKKIGRIGLSYVERDVDAKLDYNW